MSLDYIIIQAGGKGTRMERLTRNKPKALVPVNNLPMIFHLFRKFPDKRFIIIGDYKYDVLEKYLHVFADVEYQMVCGAGKQGTCAGLSEALSYIPENNDFLLIWCDLVLPGDYELPVSDYNIIGISKDFECRWKYENGRFAEEKSTGHGVAGYFIFQDKSYLRNVPKEGEFVRWLASENIPFLEHELYATHEYGLYEEWNKLPKSRCRPFNSMKISGDKIYKIPIDEQGKRLAVREVNWYKKMNAEQFKNIPKIFGYNPLCMERIEGKNVYEYTNINREEKQEILFQMISCLKQVHNLGQISADRNSYRNAYLDKTYNRLKQVRCLVPFANDGTITINGKVCRNIFYHQDAVEAMIMEYCPNEFSMIHGDCTFSNMMLGKDHTPILIDPRGYFGTTELFGDIAYDWAKLYYSLYSNYDQFNLKRFELRINQDSVELNIASNGWECMEDDFFELVGGEITRKQMRLLIAIIWLSLTTYAWEDYDSICGAFYNGIYYLEEVFES